VTQPLLSQKDANATLELIHLSLGCSNLNEYLGLVERLKTLIGFDHAQCVYGDFKKYAVKKRDAFVQACIFPNPWTDRYVKKDYLLVDPVVKASLAEIGLHYWADAFKRYTTKESIVLDHEAKSVGLCDGWIFTMAFGPSPQLVCLSMAGEQIEKTWRSMRVLELVMPHMSEALKRACRNDCAEPLPNLTPRETEVLQWLSAGKTTWEISVILKISRRTVEFHVANIVSKLDAANSRHAVAIAAAEGIIAP
jgi:DNA-binding CsgD family transcriptional regulator